MLLSDRAGREGSEPIRGAGRGAKASWDCPGGMVGTRSWQMQRGGWSGRSVMGVVLGGDKGSGLWSGVEWKVSSVDVWMEGKVVAQPSWVRGCSVETCSRGSPLSVMSAVFSFQFPPSFWTWRWELICWEDRDRLASLLFRWGQSYCRATKVPGVKMQKL